MSVTKFARWSASCPSGSPIFSVTIDPARTVIRGARISERSNRHVRTNQPAGWPSGGGNKRGCGRPADDPHGRCRGAELPPGPRPRPVAVACFASGSRGATTRRGHSSGFRWLYHGGFQDRRGPTYFGLRAPVANFGSADHSADELDLPCDRKHRLAFVAEPLSGRVSAHRPRPIRDARKLGRAAAARLQQWGTPWDKRLPLRQWLQLCAALCDITNADELAFVAQRTAAVAESVPLSPERLYVELARTELLPDVDCTGTEISGLTQPITMGDNH